MDIICNILFFILLVDFFDTEQLVESIAAILEKPTDYEEIRHCAGQTIIERFHLTTICLPAMVDYLTRSA